MTTPPAEPIRVASPDINTGAKKEEGSDDSFSGILSDLSKMSKSMEKSENWKEKDSGKHEGEDENTSADMASLTQLYELLGSLEVSAGAEQKEAIASVKAAIAGVLEGNGASGNMDIAALLTEGLRLLGSKEKEAILARMPQNLEMAQEPGSAVKEDENLLHSNLCPWRTSARRR
jgi:hypothetical protein